MARTGGWRRAGSRGRFRYLDSRGNEIKDEAKLARIEALVIPPAWRDVRISPSPTAKVQATGIDAAGRRQYIYHPGVRAQQEEAKYARLIGFGERLPDLRAAMSEHMDRDALGCERVSAITTLTKRHVRVRGHRIRVDFRGKNRAQVRTTLVDVELADAIKDLLALPGGRRVFRYEWEGDLYNLTGARLNVYIDEYMGAAYN